MRVAVGWDLFFCSSLGTIGGVRRNLWSSVEPYIRVCDKKRLICRHCVSLAPPLLNPGSAPAYVYGGWSPVFYYYQHYHCSAWLASVLSFLLSFVAVICPRPTTLSQGKVFLITTVRGVKRMPQYHADNSQSEEVFLIPLLLLSIAFNDSQ